MLESNRGIVFSAGMKSLCAWVSLVPACALFHPAAVAAETNPSKPSLLVYIGTYTGAKSRGIYSARFDPVAGTLTAPKLAAETRNPTFLAVHPNHHWLYAVGEVNNFGGAPNGSVSGFSIQKTGELTLLNQQPSGGGGPCHLSVDKSGQCVLVANYGSGSVAVLPLQPDGKLAAPSTAIQHHGSSVNPQRQAGPHAHFIVSDPANRFALACDLGLDKILVYKLAPALGTLVQNDPPWATVAPGSGPRHLAFHPNGKWVYVLNEIASSLAAFTYDPQRGALTQFQTVSTLPADFKGDNISAEIQVHPSGRFLYASNRGHDSLAVFAIDPESGKLTFVQHQPTQGKTPRHFTLDPTGRWLLAENQDSNSIVMFRVDADTGRLNPTGQRVELGSPVCVLFVATE
jgi:6-phosphogluconolactonase